MHTTDVACISIRFYPTPNNERVMLEVMHSQRFDATEASAIATSDMSTSPDGEPEYRTYSK